MHLSINTRELTNFISACVTEHVLLNSKLYFAVECLITGNTYLWGLYILCLLLYDKSAAGPHYADITNENHLRQKLKCQ